MALLRSLFWIALFLVATFAFTVLFEHGAGDFAAGSTQEWALLKTFYAEKSGGKKDAPAARP